MLQKSKIDDWMSFPEIGLAHAPEIRQYGLTEIYHRFMIFVYGYRDDSRDESNFIPLC